MDGDLVGFCEYRRDGGNLVMPHTETMPAYRGQGIADAIVRFAVADARRQELTVVPLCWFVEEFLSREP